VPGREIWGWPKKDAQIEFTEEQGAYHATVHRTGTTIIDLSLDNLKAIAPIPDSPNTPNFNLKIIPSVRKNHLPDVLQLTTSTVNSKKKALYRGNATLEFKSSPDDPLSDLAIMGIISGEQSLEDMSMDCGDVLFDYLIEDV
jgi:acetoacetate decarboxylase